MYAFRHLGTKRRMLLALATSLASSRSNYYPMADAGDGAPGVLLSPRSRASDYLHFHKAVNKRLYVRKATLQYSATEETFFEGVPCCRRRTTLPSISRPAKMNIERYWDCDYLPSRSCSKSMSMSWTRSCTRVSRPIASTSSRRSSGGVDSSHIAACLMPARDLLGGL